MAQSVLHCTCVKKCQYGGTQLSYAIPGAYLTGPETEITSAIGRVTSAHYDHSMTRSNLNKTEWLVTNTTAASKYMSKTLAYVIIFINF